MINYTCPHCAAALEAPDSIAGQDQICPICRQRTIVPVPMVRVAAPPYSNSGRAPGIIATPLLISAIWNCLAACFWFSTIFGVIFAVPLVVLLIFEFMVYAELNNKSRIVSPSKVKTIAICEVVAGLFSWGALVCGIIILMNLGKVDINGGKAPANLTPSRY